MLSSFATDAGGVATGWYMYPPLSGPRYSPGVGPDLLVLGLALVAISTLMSGVNVITTTFLLRAPGMTMWRLPIFTWNVVVTAILGLVAFPPAAPLRLAGAPGRARRTPRARSGATTCAT